MSILTTSPAKQVIPPPSSHTRLFLQSKTRTSPVDPRALWQSKQRFRSLEQIFAFETIIGEHFFRWPNTFRRRNKDVLLTLNSKRGGGGGEGEGRTSVARIIESNEISIVDVR